MNTDILSPGIRLTELAHGSGCGCKIAPAVLEEILRQSEPDEYFPELLIGNESKDDAAVWILDKENSLISTTDFFTPVVDDPFEYGRIAAANALSDVYAMGGKPIFALAILGIPVEKIPVATVREILAGAKAVCREAEIPLAGGHSIDIPEPVFGLSVNGMVRTKNLKPNNTGRVGDLLYLTKPIGSGIMATAHKRGVISPDDLQMAIGVMSRLNKEGVQFGELPFVHAMTDVTGFGLIGHLIELCEASSVSAELYFREVPLIPGIENYTSQFIFPDNTYRNWNAYEKKVSGITGPSFVPLCDPQTSGGLLVTVDPAAREEFENTLNELGLEEYSKPIGRLKSQGEYVVEVDEQFLIFV